MCTWEHACEHHLNVSLEVTFIHQSSEQTRKKFLLQNYKQAMYRFGCFILFTWGFTCLSFLYLRVLFGLRFSSFWWCSVFQFVVLRFFRRFGRECLFGSVAFVVCFFWRNSVMLRRDTVVWTGEHPKMEDDSKSGPCFLPSNKTRYRTFYAWLHDPCLIFTKKLHRCKSTLMSLRAY